MRLSDWRWNREARRWEVADTGQEFTAADAVIHGPTPIIVAVAAAIGVAVFRLFGRSRAKR